MTRLSSPSTDSASQVAFLLGLSQTIHRPILEGPDIAAVALRRRQAACNSACRIGKSLPVHLGFRSAMCGTNPLGVLQSR
eukprot:3297024-Rhodomonas_salina.2